MSVSTFFHKTLFPGCESSQELPWKWLHEAQAENAGLRADLAQRWWSPPPAPWRECDEITYGGWAHPFQKDALGNEHTVVVRYGTHQEVLMPKSCETWTAYPGTEFTWGHGGAGAYELTVTLLVHALGANEVDAAFDKGFALVGLFIDDHVRRWPDEESWEISQAAIRGWAAEQMAPKPKPRRHRAGRRRRRGSGMGLVARR